MLKISTSVLISFKKIVQSYVHLRENHYKKVFLNPTWRPAARCPLCDDDDDDGRQEIIRTLSKTLL